MADKITLTEVRAMKERGERITMLTAYDYPTALLIDQAGIDMALVGDSLGMVVHGLESTLPVTLDMMILHTRAVRRGIKRAMLIGDMPFMTYQINIEEAKRNAARFLTEGGADAVKLEGGAHMAETVRSLVEIGIAVQGHIGLTPQSISTMGGFKVQGKTLEAAHKLIADAKALEEAGAFSLILEGIPSALAEVITHSVHIPTIGIGAGVGCDGQVLVTHDVLGLFDRFTPRFVKKYADVGAVMREAFAAYRDEVRSGAFPDEEHSFAMPEEARKALAAEFGKNGKSHSGKPAKVSAKKSEEKLARLY
jgi:3-methyl-2-oxobutanoate hydroxymethyltransferase